MYNWVEQHLIQAKERGETAPPQKKTIDGLVEFGGAARGLDAGLHHVGRFGLFDARHFVALLDQHRRVFGEGALRESWPPKVLKTKHGNAAVVESSGNVASHDVTRCHFGSL